MSIDSLLDLDQTMAVPTGQPFYQVGNNIGCPCGFTVQCQSAEILAQIHRDHNCIIPKRRLEQWIEYGAIAVLAVTLIAILLTR